MVTIDALRPFQRMYNGVLIYLRLEEWPADVPLPKGATIAKTGDGPFRPYWRLVLEPERTVEVVVGWFRHVLSAEETVAWYQDNLEGLGWVIDPTRGYRKTDSAGLNFRQSQSKAKLEISILRWQNLQETTAMIRRIVEHPWSPPSNGKRAGANAKPATRTPKAKKRRVPRKAHNRVTA